MFAKEEGEEGKKKNSNGTRDREPIVKIERMNQRILEGPPMF